MRKEYNDRTPYQLEKANIRAKPLAAVLFKMMPGVIEVHSEQLEAIYPCDRRLSCLVE